MIGRHPHQTRVVHVGDVALGGSHPVRIQSMTNTDTRDVGATCAQIERLVDAGCEIVRVTTPSPRDVESLAGIRAELDRRRVRVPLVADVHFTPAAAMRALEVCEKVRINPGNFADRKRFEARSYTDSSYAAELERVAEVFRPFASRAKTLGRAIRIGTNHGSLSDRIVNRFGDSPEGMVASALEYYDVCEDVGLSSVVFSMKSSNPVVMIETMRRLVRALEGRLEGRPIPPLHLGVTEAGRGIDGRVKSAIGIGSLLSEGIGDTIRVSLTEEPEHEVPVAQSLARLRPPRSAAAPSFVSPPRERPRRARPPEVVLELGPPPSDACAAAAHVSAELGALSALDCEGLLVDLRGAGEGDELEAFVRALEAEGISIPVSVHLGIGDERARSFAGAAGVVVDVTPSDSDARLQEAARRVAALGVAGTWRLEPGDAGPAAITAVVERLRRSVEEAPGGASTLSLDVMGSPLGLRAALDAWSGAGVPCDLELRCGLAGDGGGRDPILAGAAALGGLLCEGLGERISLGVDPGLGATLDFAHRILQGARARSSRVELIACPSCGRTQFDLEAVTRRIERRTAHLKDVKIAIMGCIVNGPGEMADADFGYVGSGPGEVSLYVGRELVERRVAAAEAEERLVALIHEHGRWVEPQHAHAGESGRPEI